VRIGPLVLGDLAYGAWRRLSEREVTALRAAVGLDG
jgi:16S rRNA U516 pseudouridylate synthase RsuA-like enzyme